MRAEIIAELATAHGGSVELARDMISAARDAGADTIKLQSYDLARLNPADPQRAWLTQAHLDRAAHETLKAHAEACGVGFLSTPFDPKSLQMLREIGCTRFKIASSESRNTWWAPKRGEAWIVSHPWGDKGPDDSRRWWLDNFPEVRWLHITAIPLYPTPLECVSKAQLLDGYSDHCEGTDACRYMLAKGAKVIEAHFCLEDRGRRTVWDKTSSQMQEIRRFAESVATMTSGVNETFRNRWSA